ncbi:DHH family phosphoesterase [Oceanispirochaeta crateris]|uniref:DHH family phosphoesterase n=1 Tax=Oceanispirochaeta crateris TaxID=2518645 RepID=A0A5C1QJT2_9SPIO|nr:DHH family phosphoesterase [Oceanispirochaeta crateris]QEN06864.1 DHH family phosphoesterase [Oceanispirochaeta crateris]
MVEDLTQAMEQAISALIDSKFRKVTLLHHNDTDGLCAGTILLQALESMGWEVSRYSLEKPYPEVLNKIFTVQNQVIIFTDFAGKIAPLISRLNAGRNLVIILDHHPAERVSDESVFNMDGELYDLKGDRDISASATCTLFARALLQRFDSKESYSPHLGVLGAVGDGFLVKGCLSGVNRDILKIAREQNLIRVEESETGETYFIKLGNTEYAALEICTILDTIGGVGYYSDGPSLGIEICKNGLNPNIASYMNQLLEEKDLIFDREIQNLQKNIRTTDHLQWFNVEDRFRPMGVKMIGVFCTQIKDEPFLDPTKYLAGFQNVPDMVPGFGEINFDSSKISMRVSKELTEKIRKGEIPGLNTFLPEATTRLGGFSDACHGLSAATTVKIGQEEMLINEMENVLHKKDGKS